MKSTHVAFAAALLLVACSSERRGPGGPGDLGVSYGPDLASIYGKGDDPNQPAMCDAGTTSPTCTAQPVEDGCGPTELCGDDGHGNGLDDNCDGKVDDICSCNSGQVKKCFVGPPGRHGVGACTDGQQTCEGGEIAFWGPCVGGIAPKSETCDGLDNDCDGCADESLCCDAKLACPSSVPDTLPFSDVTYPGGQYFLGTAATWSWKVTGGPCDRLFETTTGSPPAQSFAITGANTATPKVHYTLSGDYTVTLTVTDTAGATWSCGFIQHVGGPGVRFELCWDTTGIFGDDLDLHVHKPNSTTPFFNSMGTTHSTDDCNYQNCKAEPFGGDPAPDWGYSTTPLAACSGGPEGAAWIAQGACRNPRLDIDNISNVGTPENINIDQPKNGDSFRALVHYYSSGLFAGSGSGTHPIVNIYCGGRLKATYGQAPDQVPGFTKAGAWAGGDMWRVADVAAIVDANGTTTDCTISPLHPTGMTSGYRVGHDGNISYEGN